MHFQYVKDDYAQCEHCRCMRPKSELRIAAQWEPTMLHCKDADWCLRTARISEEVRAEFDRASPSLGEMIERNSIYTVDKATHSYRKHADAKKTKRRKAKTVRVCDCGKDITLMRAQAKYCSPRCQKRVAARKAARR